MPQIKKSFVQNVKKKVSSNVKEKLSAKISKIWAKKINEFLEVKLGEPTLIIGTANVICGKATWSPLIKTAFGRFNKLVYIMYAWYFDDRYF